MNTVVPPPNAPSPLRRLLTHYAWRYRWSYLAGGLFLVLTNWLTVSIPGEIGGAIDALRSDASVGGFVAAIAAMGLGIIVVRSLSRILIFNPGRDLEYELRKDLFDHLLRLQPSFFATKKRGDIVSRAANDITWVRTLVGYGGLQIVNVTLAVGLTGWKMLALSPRLTVLVLLPIVVGMAVVQWAIRRLFALSRRNQEQLGEISEHVLGSLQGMAAIQGFVAERAFIERFEARNREWLATGMKLAVIRAGALPLLVLAGGIAMVVLIAVGGPMVFAGSLTVGDLAAFSALLTVFLPPLRSLGWMLSVIQRGRAALERIFELLDAPVDRPEGDEGDVLPAGRGPKIVVRGMDFAYPDEPGNLVLQDLSLTIPAGAVVGIFGRTGSGKSTLLRVLARLYNPPPGTVFVDGVDLLTLDLGHWRERLAVAPQRPFLFSDSIAANIGLDAAADGDRVSRSVNAAALDPDLEALPEGLGTVVGERGIMLSGGQRQRVALARALYRSGDLLILDDVLSAVDHSTEAHLVETVAGLARRDSSPTVIIASHRQSALRHCEQVFVLERGRLVDSGSHRELVKRPGPYRDSWLIQSQRAAAAKEAAS
ncbi:MAG TPA: ABC transporter ATP-binding protein [Candidatus Sulfomarinibacteraceae bacterium]|nr:ABC transporter ATP-binding protein [Candidatus Sulfomarinibacteraceae bacterium]